MGLAVPLHELLEHDALGRHVDAQREGLGGEDDLAPPGREELLDAQLRLATAGFSVVVVLGSIGLLPDFARLLTGRLHRWTLILGPDELTYRGYRTNVSYLWKEISGAKIQQRGPAGVRIDLRGAQRKDPVVPITAFTVPAEQFIDEIVEARKAARR